MSDNKPKRPEIAFTSRNDEVLLIQGEHIFGAASVEEANVLLKQLKAAIASASVKAGGQC